MGDRAHLVHHHRHNKKAFLITTESIELKLMPNLRHLKLHIEMEGHQFVIL